MGAPRSKEQNQIHVDFADGSRATADGVVIAAYAGTNALRAAFQLPELPHSFELAEVILGQDGPELKDIGFTVMDRPFWSLMPFGNGSRKLTDKSLQREACGSY